MLWDISLMACLCRSGLRQYPGAVPAYSRHFGRRLLCPGSPIAVAMDSSSEDIESTYKASLWEEPEGNRKNHLPRRKILVLRLTQSAQKGTSSMETLITKWGRALDTDHVLTEYPRPQLVRDSYLNLNGYWEYAIRCDREEPAEYDGKILVPFSPETLLSGVGRRLMPEEYLFYRRTVVLTDSFSAGRLLLHFGAVDQSCEVFWNGKMVGSHMGGYLPFTIEVTDAAKPGENELKLVVRDITDTSYHARGKQTLQPKGMWYTAQSGIWQTVWMECVPCRYIEKLWMEPDYDARSLRLKVCTHLYVEKEGIAGAGESLAADRETEALSEEASSEFKKPVCHVRISYLGKTVLETGITADELAVIRIPDNEFHPWSPETPDLYDLEVMMDMDRAASYFGMRKVHVSRDGKGILRFFLNNQPYFHLGLLDQGYWPEGMYTAPSDEALIDDISRMKNMGFNMLRKHIKIEADRWYYHCDRLGMLVWQDMVNGGGNYDMNYLCNLPNIMVWTERHIHDDEKHYRKFAREDPKGREEYYSELCATIDALHEHPSIVAWVPFNEGWGQFDAPKATAMIRALDSTRLIDEASGWFDQKGGDMYSMHNYFYRLRVKPQPDRVVAVTECGGYSCQIEGHSSCDKVYGYRKFRTTEELSDGLWRLWKKELIPAVKNGLCAIVFTQVSDVETEVNGLLTWDREVQKVPDETMWEMNSELLEEFKIVNR